MYTAVVTGARGQDGSYLCELLEEKGYHVVKFTGDVRDYDEMYETIKKSIPDEIYNLAAKIHHGSPKDTLHVNTSGILNIMEAVKNLGIESKCKIFQASSSEIFANTESTWPSPQTVCTMRGYRNIYGLSKITADSLVSYYRKTYGMYVCSGILYNHESPRRPDIYVTQKIIKGLQSGKCFQVGNLESKRDWGHAKDYVKAMWMIIQQPHPQDYIIATGTTYSVREFIEIAAEKMNKRIEWSGEGTDEVGRIDGEVMIEVSSEFYRPDNGTLLVGNNDPIRKLGWTREYDIHSLIEDMLKT
jgi:GDPmannose 4,6-dehydratase